MATVDVWGKAGWTFLHSISYSYPEKPTEEEKESMVSFLKGVGDVLPCPTCKKHYNDFMTERMDDAVESKGTLTYALWTLHNQVNRRTEKPEMCFDTVCEMYKPPLEATSCSLSSGEGGGGGLGQGILYLVSAAILLVVLLNLK